MKRFSRFAGVGVTLTLCALAVFSVLHATSQAQKAASSPPLGTASNFAVLGGQTVTNTGPTVVNGNLGVSPGSAVTGFPPGIVHGAIHKAGAQAGQAQSDVTMAYNDAAGQSCNHDLTGQDLGGKTLVAGVYCFSSSAQLTGNVTLSGGGVFLFQIGSKLTTASNASVSLIGGAEPCNVFWQIGSSATIGTGTRFVGNILALTSIAAQTGATFNGGLSARNGAVTLDSNTITRASCARGGTPTPTATGPPTAIPSPHPTYPKMPNTGSDPYKP